MTGLRQTWLVALRELRERSRSKGLWAGTALMLLVVVAAIVVPALVDSVTVTRDVGFTGDVRGALPRLVVEQGAAVDITVRVHRYDDVAAGEDAVRDEDVDVLVVGTRQLMWRGEPDERLRAVVTGAIQLVVVQERAATAGIGPDQLAALAKPVPVENEELGIAKGRSEDDETAAYVVSILLLMAVVTYGQLVLTGVVQEKSSRVVEVLLARMPARNLLAGKIAGIGLIGFAQFVVTAAAALVATIAVDSVDIPAISVGVLVWVVVWFVLGYVMYAVCYGAFGSLASRTEDASSIAAPVTTALVVGYWGSLLAVGRDPDAVLAKVVSLFPVSAPFAMPGRIALGATAWWEPVLAVALTVAAIGGLIAFAARVYTGAILQTGATLKLREAWRRSPGMEAAAAAPVRRGWVSDRFTIVLLGVAACTGVAVAVVATDVILGIGVGAACFAVGTRAAKAWTGDGDRHASRP